MQRGLGAIHRTNRFSWRSEPSGILLWGFDIADIQTGKNKDHQLYLRVSVASDWLGNTKFSSVPDAFLYDNLLESAAKAQVSG